MKIKELFQNPKFPIELFNSNGNEIYYENSSGSWYKQEFDSNGNRIYSEDSSGSWYKQEYDSNGNRIYYEDSEGKIIDKRPKVELPDIPKDGKGVRSIIPTEKIKENKKPDWSTKKEYIELEKFLRQFEGDFAIHTRVRELILRKIFDIKR